MMHGQNHFKFIISIWNNEELPEEWKESIIVPIHKKGNKTDLITIGAYKMPLRLSWLLKS